MSDSRETGELVLVRGRVLANGWIAIRDQACGDEWVMPPQEDVLAFSSPSDLVDRLRCGPPEDGLMVEAADCIAQLEAELEATRQALALVVDVGRDFNCDFCGFKDEAAAGPCGQGTGDDSG